MLDMKAHYLDLLSSALEAGRGKCLHRPDPNGKDDAGCIYVVEKDEAGATRSDIVIKYEFGPDAFGLVVQFRDSRPQFKWHGFYQDGLDDLWPRLLRAINVNRLAHRAA
jgi:hypothetical protein